MATFALGDPESLAHLFSVVLNEYAFVDAMPGNGKLTEAQFHEFVDGALRDSTQVILHAK